MSSRGGPDKSLAAELPIARVAVDVPLAHLDRPFDYLVTTAQSTAAQPGVRVRVRFSGRLIDGFILERLVESDHGGRLSPLDRVLGAEPVLAPEIVTLAREVADRYAGTFADVVRLAVPPRHATAERAVGSVAASWSAADIAASLGESRDILGRYDGGDALVDDLSAGRAARRSWQLAPGDWPTQIAATVAATSAAGRGVIVVVPDARDLSRVDAALVAALGTGRHVSLSADLGPAERYRRFLRVSRGQVSVVAGTRGAGWAPVRDLGLVVVWDDGDDLHAEPRAPYPHVREVAVLRAHRADAALLLAGFAVTAETAQLVESGWLSSLRPAAGVLPAAAPLVTAAGADVQLARDEAARTARLPSVAWQVARQGLERGPVLIQVPRRGYQPGLACATCRTPARCARCAGPLARRGENRPPVCRWCGTAEAAFQCSVCGGSELRATVTGAVRTAEELGRAFSGVPVLTSGGDNILDRVPDRPALVVATPGAEPVAANGYAAALLLDAWAMLGRPDLRAGEETLRRWLNAAALVQGRDRGGEVMVVAPGELRQVQALVRWQPGWYAGHELQDRQQLHLPPAGRVASLTGQPAAVAELLAAVDLPPGAEVLGPVPAGSHREDVERMLVRVPRRAGRGLAAALKAAEATRSAQKAPATVRVQLDPIEIG